MSSTYTTAGRTAREGWVDFRAVKSAVSLEQVLVRYGVTLSPRGDSLVGRCPIHKGMHNSNAFHVNPGKNAWKCFGDCRAGGNQLDFVMRIEGVDLRLAAILLQQWFEDDAPAPSKETRTAPAVVHDREAEMPPRCPSSSRWTTGTPTSRLAGCMRTR